MEISVPTWIIGSLLIVLCIVRETFTWRRRRRDRSMVALAGAALCGWNLPLMLLAFAGMAYAVVSEDMILTAVGFGALFIGNFLFLYVGRDGVLIGGKLYGWDRIAHCSIQSSKFDETSAYRHVMIIKLKHWPSPKSINYCDQVQMKDFRGGVRAIGIRDQ